MTVTVLNKNTATIQTTSFSELCSIGQARFLVRGLRGPSTVCKSNEASVSVELAPVDAVKSTFQTAQQPFNALARNNRLFAKTR
jgi:hypothetical protein